MGRDTKSKTPDTNQLIKAWREIDYTWEDPNKGKKFWDKQPKKMLENVSDLLDLAEDRGIRMGMGRRGKGLHTTEYWRLDFQKETTHGISTAPRHYVLAVQDNREPGVRPSS